MTDISQELVKELRNRTGVGVGKCKEALTAANGDLELAIANLRKAGIASAVKKESRETNEGLVVFSEAPGSLSLVEIYAETDFVVKNDTFQDFARSLADQVVHQSIASLEDLLSKPYAKDPKSSVDEIRAITMQSLGENIQIKRVQLLKKPAHHSFGVYSHAGGKLVTLVEIAGSDQEQALAKDIAMHIAAESPDYISSNEIPADLIHQEREIARAQVKNKPEAIVEKIIEGKLQAFYNQVCLLNQPFVKNPDLTIAQLLENQSKKTGKQLSIVQFLRWKVGK